MSNAEIGNYVETIHGVNGILTAIKDTYYGPMAFIATADMRVFHCPVSDLIVATQPIQQYKEAIEICVKQAYMKMNKEE